MILDFPPGSLAANWQQLSRSGGGLPVTERAQSLSPHRGDDLCKSMSSYLAHRIMNTPNIEVCTTVVGMQPDGHLSSVEILNKTTGEKRTLETAALFSFIGAMHRTDWLSPEIEKDSKNFVRTGFDFDNLPWLDFEAAAISP